MSDHFQTVELRPNLIGFGNRPERHPSHQVLFDTGIIGVTGGTDSLSPMICLILA
jgi:hypothetical protein